ncbi:MAG: radical SAM protein [Promethearchaeota archaeon]
MKQEKSGEKIKKFLRKTKKRILPRIILAEDAKRVYSALIEFRDIGDHKFHLRLLKNGKGVLIVDAEAVLYLNHVAMVYFKQFIKGKSIEQIQDYFVKYYKTTRDEVEEDYANLMDKVEILLTQEDVDPFLNLASERTPFKVSEFPLRVDLAITYRCNNSCGHCYVARERTFPELDTEGIKRILDALWEVGVPHVALTGGEPTMRADLLEIIEYGQQVGFVMGIITNGRKFADENLVKQAIAKGLDYAQITLESSDKEIHDKMVGEKGAYEETIQAIKNFEKEDIFFMTNTTLCKNNIESIDETVKLLNSLNVRTFACNGLIYSGKGKEFEDGIAEEDLEPILNRVNYLARKLEMKFIWYTPTQYCVFNPLEIGLGAKRCSAANISIAIEPNGDVLPCQSYYESVGNILKDDWEKIWYSELFESIRNNEYIEPKCKNCELLQVCGGGCPLYIDKKKLHCNIASF